MLVAARGTVCALTCMSTRSVDRRDDPRLVHRVDRLERALFPVPIDDSIT